ncbi:hypothetical protein V496_07564 [Pseudogymnoascus sp. VKM F-4515 (FW-2607)]|nr:hypothetical protein V496_07564 [Pseudogymnoascus sp. VKM F-4515 (FW-2607)]
MHLGLPKPLTASHPLTLPSHFKSRLKKISDNLPQIPQQTTISRKPQPIQGQAGSITASHNTQPPAPSHELKKHKPALPPHTTRALEHYEDPAAIKRVIVNIVATPTFNQDWLTNFFGRFSVEQSLDCLDAMMQSNIRQNLQAVVHIATKYSDLLGGTKLIDLFEKYNTVGLLYYLGSIVNVSEDPDVNFKYMGIRFTYPYAVISAPPSPLPKSILAAAIQPRRPPAFPLDFSYIAAGPTDVGGGSSGRYAQNPPQVEHRLPCELAALKDSEHLLAEPVRSLAALLGSVSQEDRKGGLP